MQYEGRPREVNRVRLAPSPLRPEGKDRGNRLCVTVDDPHRQLHLLRRQRRRPRRRLDVRRPQGGLLEIHGQQFLVVRHGRGVLVAPEENVGQPAASPLVLRPLRQDGPALLLRLGEPPRRAAEDDQLKAVVQVERQAFVQFQPRLVLACRRQHAGQFSACFRIFWTERHGLVQQPRGLAFFLLPVQNPGQARQVHDPVRRRFRRGLFGDAQRQPHLLRRQRPLGHAGDGVDVTGPQLRLIEVRRQRLLQPRQGPGRVAAPQRRLGQLPLQSGVVGIVAGQFLQPVHRLLEPAGRRQHPRDFPPHLRVVRRGRRRPVEQRVGPIFSTLAVQRPGQPRQVERLVRHVRRRRLLGQLLDDFHLGRRQNALAGRGGRVHVGAPQVGSAEVRRQQGLQPGQRRGGVAGPQLDLGQPRLQRRVVRVGLGRFLQPRQRLLRPARGDQAPRHFFPHFDVVRPQRHGAIQKRRCPHAQRWRLRPAPLAPQRPRQPR